MNYKIINKSILLSLDRDEYINSSIKNIFKKEEFEFGWIRGIGAVRNIEIGFYDLESKQYVKKKIKEEHELLSMMGNVTFVDDDYFIHAHVNLSGKSFKSFGGHLFEAQISLTGEFKIDILDCRINRRFSNEIGLNLWSIE